VTTTETAEPDTGPSITVQPYRGWLSPAEAAAYTGLAESLIRRFVRLGVIPASQLVKAGRILIERSALDDFLRANRIDPEADPAEVERERQEYRRDVIHGHGRRSE